MKKVINFIKDTCKETVMSIMRWARMDATDFVELAWVEERACIIFGILVGISMLLYGIFDLVVLPILIASYAIADVMIINIGVSELEMEEYEKVINEIEEDINEMKRKLF